jgi:hypothetical protein
LSTSPKVTALTREEELQRATSERPRLRLVGAASVNARQLSNGIDVSAPLAEAQKLGEKKCLG